MNQTPEQILRSAKTILLVDWPDQGIPRSLLKAGLTVYGFSPGGYSKANKPTNKESAAIFQPEEGEKGYLIFQKIEGKPGPVDIVYVYRPETEHELILKNHVLPLGAKIIWLQPPVTSSAIGRLAAKQGIKIIEGINIAEAAAKI